MAEEYNGYLLEEELKSNNSGFARWGFAKKNEKIYFIKEFLSPAYPVDTEMFSERQLESKRKNCHQFEKDKMILYRRINRASDGNAQRIEEFFRCGSKYYIVMEKLFSMDYTPEMVAKQPYRQKMLLCKVLAHSLMKLHEAGIVHSDMKWENLIFVQTGEENAFTVKLIDFDNSFFEAKPPVEAEDLNLDQVYCSPEAFLFLNEEEVVLNREMDVYALGIIFHQIFAGELPKVDEKYQYIYEAQLDDSTIQFSGELPDPVCKLVEKMLTQQPEERITAKEVFEQLREIDAPKSVPKSVSQNVPESVQEQASKETSVNVMEKTSKETLLNVTEKTSKEIPVNVTEQASGGIPVNITEKASKETPVNVTEKASKEIPVNVMKKEMPQKSRLKIRVSEKPVNTEKTIDTEETNPAKSYFSVAGDL